MGRRPVLSTWLLLAGIIGKGGGRVEKERRKEGSEKVERGGVESNGRGEVRDEKRRSEKKGCRREMRSRTGGGDRRWTMSP